MKRRPARDVYLSATSHDEAKARIVQRAFEEAGTTVFSSAEVPVGSRWVDVIRDAMGEARAFVALLSRPALHSDWVLFEIGGALAWKLRMYPLLDRVAPRDVPAPLRSIQARPLSKLPVLVDAVRREMTSLTAREIEVLIRVYRKLGRSTDELGTEYDTLVELARRVNTECGTDHEPERLLRELNRLSIQGELPPSRPRKSSPEGPDNRPRSRIRPGTIPRNR